AGTAPAAEGATVARRVVGPAQNLRSILHAVFALELQGLVPLLNIAGVFVVPLMAVTWYLDSSAVRNINAFVSAITNAALVAAYATLMEGTRVSVLGAFREGNRHAGRVIGIGLVLGIVIGLPLVLFGALAWFWSPLFALPGLLVVWFLGTRYGLAVQA